METREIRTHTSSGRKKTKEEMIASYYSRYKVKCKCGHSMFMPYGTDIKICSHCGHKVFKNGQIEFREKMKETLRRKSDD